MSQVSLRLYNDLNSNGLAGQRLKFSCLQGDARSVGQELSWKMECSAMRASMEAASAAYVSIALCQALVTNVYVGKHVELAEGLQVSVGDVAHVVQMV